MSFGMMAPNISTAIMSKGFQVSSTLQPPAVEPRVGRALAIALGGMVRGRALALAIRGALLTLVCDAKNGASVQDQARGVLRGRMVRRPADQPRARTGRAGRARFGAAVPSERSREREFIRSQRP